jgi:Ca2+-binding EF-hand superfamily protein
MEGERTVMKGIVVLVVLVVSMGVFSTVNADEREANARNAFKMILSQADTNGDGKLSMDECMGIYKDKDMAKKNCTFWDVNKDGIITEDEYVKQAMSMGSKKKGTGSNQKKQ